MIFSVFFQHLAVPYFRLGMIFQRLTFRCRQLYIYRVTACPRSRTLLELNFNLLQMRRLELGTTMLTYTLSLLSVARMQSLLVFGNWLKNIRRQQHKWHDKSIKFFLRGYHDSCFLSQVKRYNCLGKMDTESPFPLLVQPLVG